MMQRLGEALRRQRSLVGILIVAGGLLVGNLVTGQEPLLGLDLQGGVEVVLRPVEGDQEVTADALDQALEIIRNRVDALGVAEPDITVQGGNIVVQLPGVDDQDRAIALVGQTAELRFRPLLARPVSEAEIAEYQAAVEAEAAAGEAGTEAAEAAVDPPFEEMVVTVGPDGETVVEENPEDFLTEEEQASAAEDAATTDLGEVTVTVGEDGEVVVGEPGAAEQEAAAGGDETTTDLGEVTVTVGEDGEVVVGEPGAADAAAADTDGSDAATGEDSTTTDVGEVVVTVGPDGEVVVGDPAAEDAAGDGSADAAASEEAGADEGDEIVVGLDESATVVVGPEGPVQTDAAATDAGAEATDPAAEVSPEGAPDAATPEGTADPVDDGVLTVEDLLSGVLTDPADDDPDATVILEGSLGPDGQVVRYLMGPAITTGAALESAAPVLELAQWQVRVTALEGAEGIDRFNEAAQVCYYENPDPQICPTGQLGIVLDHIVESAPVVNAASFERDGINITGAFDETEARDLALVLDYGALPLEFEDPAEAGLVRTVSATLGRDALRAGLIAGLVGLAAVALYMLAYYRLLGLAALGSLVISGLLLWVIVSFLSATQGLALTLAGITGLIVAIGVSLDSNVIYFEHLKEDLLDGRTLRSSVDQAFPVAFRTIFWANLATLIGAGILWLLTIGSVRGFAAMLAIASILDLVATYFFLRPVVRWLARRSEQRPGLVGMATVTAAAAAAAAAGTSGERR